AEVSTQPGMNPRRGFHHQGHRRGIETDGVADSLGVEVGFIRGICARGAKPEPVGRLADRLDDDVDQDARLVAALEAELPGYVAELPELPAETGDAVGTHVDAALALPALHPDLADVAELALLAELAELSELAELDAAELETAELEAANLTELEAAEL